MWRTNNEKTNSKTLNDCFPLKHGSHAAAKLRKFVLDEIQKEGLVDKEEMQNAGHEGHSNGNNSDLTEILYLSVKHIYIIKIKI